MVGRLITILSLVHFLKFVNTQVTYPSAVNLTVVKVTHTGQTSSVTVAWDPPRRVTAHQVSSYTVQIQSSRDPSIFQQSTYAVGSNLMHTFRRLKPDITYSIDVIVSYEGGDSNAIRIKVRLNYNECERGTHNCDHICIDTPSSFLCSCRSGYTLKNQYQCIAIDPCTNGNHSCTADQLCHSSNGSYSCSSCDQGFRVSNNTCIDVDECQSNTDECQHNCTNTDGSYECYCWDGYRLGTDNHSCTDVNECEEDLNECAQHCHNLPGTYNCHCEEGYVLEEDGFTCSANCSRGMKYGEDRFTCVDIDECSEQRHECSSIQMCENTNGSYNCFDCPTGFEQAENPTTCRDINECDTLILNNCSQRCINFDHGYECTCNESFYLGKDKKSCLQFSLENINGLITNYSNLSESNAKELLEEVSSLAPYLSNTVKTVDFNDSNTTDLYEGYAELFKTVVNVRRNSSAYNQSLSTEEDNNLITNLVNVTGSLLSTDIVSNLTKMESSNSSVKNVISSVVVNVESLATVVAATVDGDNETSKSFSSGNIKMQAALYPDFSRVLDESGGAVFNIPILAPGKRLILTTVSFGEIGNVLPKDAQDEVGSNVVSIQFSAENSQESAKVTSSDPDLYPFEITFKDIESKKDVECVFYKYDKSGNPIGWSKDGVRTEKGNSSVVCKSNHLTSFAVLVNVGGVKHDEITEMALRYFSYIGCGVSIVCLLTTAIVLCTFRCKGQKNPLNFVHINLSVVLLLALVVFIAASWHARTARVLCFVVAGLLHYLFLSTFCWMLCEGVMLYLLVVKVFSKLPKRLWFFLLIGYGIPLPAIIVTAAIRHEQYGSEEFGCFLSPQFGTIWGFAGVALAVIFINLVFLGMALVQLYRTQKSAASGSSANLDTIKATVKAAILLLPIMGLTWVFGFISLDYGVDALRTLTLIFNIIFIILNSLQGVFIFSFYVLRNEKLKPFWQRACGRIFKPKTSNSHTAASKSASTYQTNDAMSGAPKSTLDYSVVDSKAEKTVITMSDKKFDEASITEGDLLTTSKFTEQNEDSERYIELNGRNDNSISSAGVIASERDYVNVEQTATDICNDTCEFTTFKPTLNTKNI